MTTLKRDLRQSHFEAFEEEFQSETPQGMSKTAGHVVRSAAKAGWFENGFKPEDVDNMKPAAVRELSRQIDQLYIDLTTVEKK